MADYDVFISYSWRADADRELADRLEAELTTRGLRVWRDVHQIRAGEVISRALEEAVRTSTLVVPLLSELHQSSNVCRWEILSALAQAPVGARVPPLFAVLREGRGIPAAYPPAVFEANAGFWDGSDEGLSRLGDAIVELLDRARTQGSERPSLQKRSRIVGSPGVTGSRFVGRFPDLLRMYARLVSGLAPLDAAGVQHGPALLLHGEPGMGKTSLAAFFAEWFARRFELGVLWLDAAGDRVDARISDDSEREMVVRSLSAVAERWLRSPERGADVANLSADPDMRWADIRSRIASHVDRTGGRLLLVVDDVPQGINLGDLTMESDRIATLFTARGRSLADQGAAYIRVDKFQPFESMLLLSNARDPEGVQRRQARDPWQGAAPVAAELAEEVGHHPMAIDLLGLRLRDPGVGPGALLDEVRANAGDFIDVGNVTLPLQHRGSILATVGGSLRSAVHADSAVAPLLRLLAVAPAGRPVRLDALSFAVTPAQGSVLPLVDELVRQGILRFRAGPDGDQATQHQIVQAVTRELWRRDADPFLPGPERPQEPDLSYRFAQWHYEEGEGLRNTDDAKAAETHGVALHVLAQTAAVWRPGREQALQIAYGLLAQARLTYRAGSATNNPGDYDTALAIIGRAEAALEPYREHLAVNFAYHTAEAMRGLVLSNGSEITASGRSQAAREALTVVLAADDARSRIAREILQQPPATSALDHDYVRDVLARSRYNIAGRAFGIVRALRKERPDDWVEQAHALLAGAERSYREVLELRRQLWGDELSTPSQILSQASSRHGIGMVAYYQALLPEAADQRLRSLENALVELRAGLEMRDRGHNEADVCKSLAMLLKVLLAWCTIRSGDVDEVLALQRARWLTSMEDAEQFRGMRYTPGSTSSRVLAHRADFKDDLLTRLTALRRDDVDDAEFAGAADEVVRWLALAHVTGIWNPATPETPDDLCAELHQLLERP